MIPLEFDRDCVPSVAECMVYSGITTRDSSSIDKVVSENRSRLFSVPSADPLVLQAVQLVTYNIGTKCTTFHPASSESNNRRRHLYLSHSTYQEALTELGRPSRIYRKSPDSSQDFFANYFHIGVDLMFDGRSDNRHVLKKLIFHSNCVNHFDFGRYERCPLQLLSDFQSPITFTSNWSEVERFIDGGQQHASYQSVGSVESRSYSTSGGNPQQRPVILDRMDTLGSAEQHEQNPFGSTRWQSFSNIIFEVRKFFDELYYY